MSIDKCYNITYNRVCETIALLMEVGDMSTIREGRKAVGLTQGKLAEKMGVTRTTVTKWETGKAFPKTKMLIQLSEILKISVENLLNAG